MKPFPRKALPKGVCEFCDSKEDVRTMEVTLKNNTQKKVTMCKTHRWDLFMFHLTGKSKLAKPKQV